jgi:hypothetical protein
MNYNIGRFLFLLYKHLRQWAEVAAEVPDGCRKKQQQ